MWVVLMTPTRVPRLFFMHMQIHMAIPAMTPMMNTIPNTMPAIAVPLKRKSESTFIEKAHKDSSAFQL